MVVYIKLFGFVSYVSSIFACFKRQRWELTFEIPKKYKYSRMLKIIPRFKFKPRYVESDGVSIIVASIRWCVFQSPPDSRGVDSVDSSSSLARDTPKQGLKATMGWKRAATATSYLPCSAREKKAGTRGEGKVRGVASWEVKGGGASLPEWNNWKPAAVPIQDRYPPGLKVRSISTSLFLARD